MDQAGIRLHLQTLGLNDEGEITVHGGLVGIGGVGKTSFLTCLATGRVEVWRGATHGQYRNTGQAQLVVVDLEVESLTFPALRRVKVNALDTSGQELCRGELAVPYRPLPGQSPFYKRGNSDNGPADFLLFICDLSSTDTIPYLRQKGWDNGALPFLLEASDLNQKNPPCFQLCEDTATNWQRRQDATNAGKTGLAVAFVGNKLDILSSTVRDQKIKPPVDVPFYRISISTTQAEKWGCLKPNTRKDLLPTEPANFWDALLFVLRATTGLDDLQFARGTLAQLQNIQVVQVDRPPALVGDNG